MYHPKGILTKLVNILMCGALICMVVLTFYNAILRYVFNSSMVSSEELSRFCFIWISYLGILMAYRSGEHVSVTILTDHLTGVWKLIVQILCDICVFLIMVLIFIGGIQNMINSNYPSVATGINFALIVVVLPISAGGILVCWAIDVVGRYFKKEA